MTLCHCSCSRQIQIWNSLCIFSLTAGRAVRTWYAILIPSHGCQLCWREGKVYTVFWRCSPEKSYFPEEQRWLFHLTWHSSAEFIDILPYLICLQHLGRQKWVSQRGLLLISENEIIQHSALSPILPQGLFLSPSQSASLTSSLVLWGYCFCATISASEPPSFYQLRLSLLPRSYLNWGRERIFLELLVLACTTCCLETQVTCFQSGAGYHLYRMDFAGFPCHCQR